MAGLVVVPRAQSAIGGLMSGFANTYVPAYQDQQAGERLMQGYKQMLAAWEANGRQGPRPQMPQSTHGMQSPEETTQYPQQAAVPAEKGAGQRFSDLLQAYQGGKTRNGGW